jgi:CheY-like chemotaxis protein
VKDQSQPPTLLIIEDSDEYFEVLSRTIEHASSKAISISRCIDGDDALDYLHHEGVYRDRLNCPNPDLVLLDLNLPGTDGREVLTIIKQTDSLKTIPVAILTTSANPQDVHSCYQAGANTYILKPMGINDLRDLLRVFLDYWFTRAVLPTEIDDRL